MCRFQICKILDQVLDAVSSYATLYGEKRAQILIINKAREWLALPPINEQLVTIGCILIMIKVIVFEGTVKGTTCRSIYGEN